MRTELDRALAELDEATLRIQQLVDSFPDRDFSDQKRAAIRALWKVEDAERLLTEAWRGWLGAIPICDLSREQNDELTRLLDRRDR